MQSESVLDESKIEEYKKQARAYIVPRVAEFAEKFGFQYICVVFKLGIWSTKILEFCCEPCCFRGA